MVESMQAAIFLGEGRLELKDRPVPEVKHRDDVLILVEAASVCGSDIHILCNRKFPLRKELSERLKGKGITSYRIEKILPTLEDVFVTNSRRYGIDV